MKRFFAAILALSFLAPLLVSCSKELDPTLTIREFCVSYGVETTVYSSRASEGDDGYADANFLPNLLGSEAEGIREFAVALRTSLDGNFEVGIFLCKTVYDARAVSLACLERIELVRVLCESTDKPISDGAFVAIYGTAVVYSITDDNDLSRRLFDALLS